MIATWLVVGGMVGLWLADAMWRAEAPLRRQSDPTNCACCRHDRIAHDARPGSQACSQCPCSGFRAA